MREESNELHAMRTAVESPLVQLKDREVPAKSFLAAKLEQIEMNQPAADTAPDFPKGAFRLSLLSVCGYSTGPHNFIGLLDSWVDPEVQCHSPRNL